MMTIADAINVLSIEKQCVKMANECDRECGKCPLVLPDEEILTAYEMAQNALMLMMYVNGVAPVRREDGWGEE